jgi:hypothetical protein
MLGQKGVPRLQKTIVLGDHTLHPTDGTLKRRDRILQNNVAPRGIDRFRQNVGDPGQEINGVLVIVMYRPFGSCGEHYHDPRREPTLIGS